MHTYISPIGYDSTRVTRPILNQGISSGDRIWLLQPAGQGETGQAAQAVGDVERLVKEIEPEIEFETIGVKYDDFYKSIEQCLDEIDAAEGEVVVILGGGARDVFLPLALATVMRKYQVDNILQYSDITGQVVELEFPNLLADVSKSQFETLSTIASKGERITLSQLADELGAVNSTITRHVDHLESEELVTTTTEGRAKLVSATRIGELYVRMRRDK